MLVERIKNAALDLAERYQNQSVLLVAHSHVIKALMIYAHPEKYTFADLIRHVDIIRFEIKDHVVKVI
jgi:broad specificity phosphatase PhoE